MSRKEITLKVKGGRQSIKHVPNGKSGDLEGKVHMKGSLKVRWKNG